MALVHDFYHKKKVAKGSLRHKSSTIQGEGTKERIYVFCLFKKSPMIINNISTYISLSDLFQNKRSQFTKVFAMSIMIKGDVFRSTSCLCIPYDVFCTPPAWHKRIYCIESIQVYSH